MSSESATPSEPTVRRPRQGRQTAERILDVAEALFAERGYAGTTLRDVAAEVGLQNPSLYNHFKSKESLYSAVLERGVRPVLEALSDYVESGQRDSAQIVGRVMEILARRPELPRLVLHETLSGGQHLTAMLQRWIAPTFARAGEAIATRSPSRGWTQEQIPLLVLAMYHIVVGYFSIAPLYRELYGEDLLSPEALARQTRFLDQVASVLFENDPPK